MITSDMLINKFNALRDTARNDAFKAFCYCNGFNSEGKTYVPAVHSEESCAAMRENDCPYCKALGYHSPSPIRGVDMVAVDVSDVTVYVDKWERYRFDNMKCRDKLAQIYRSRMKAGEEGAGFAGNIGDKCIATVKFTSCTNVPSNSDFGDFAILHFVDKDGYMYSWMQRNYKEDTIRSFIDKYSKRGWVTLSGFVKRHETIRAKMYTRLTRCEIVGKGNKAISDYALKLRAHDCDL